MAIPTHGFLSPWLERLFLAQRNTHESTLPPEACPDGVKVQVIKSLGTTTPEQSPGGEALVWTEVNDGEAWIACCVPQSVVDAFGANRPEGFGSYCALKSTFRLRKWSFVLARPPLPLATMSPSKARAATARGAALQSERLCLRAEEVGFLGVGDGARVLTMRGETGVGEFRGREGVKEWVRKVEERDGRLEKKGEQVVYDGELLTLPHTRSTRPSTAPHPVASSVTAPASTAQPSASTSAARPLPKPTDWSLAPATKHTTKRRLLKAKLAEEKAKRAKEEKEGGAEQKPKARGDTGKGKEKENVAAVPSAPPPPPPQNNAPSPSRASSPFTFSALDLPPPPSPAPASPPAPSLPPNSRQPAPPPARSSPLLPSDDDLANADFGSLDLDALPPSTAYPAGVGAGKGKGKEGGMPPSRQPEPQWEGDEEDEVLSQAKAEEEEGLEVPPTSDAIEADQEEPQWSGREDQEESDEDEDDGDDAEVAALLTQPQQPQQQQQQQPSTFASAASLLGRAPPARQPLPRSSTSSTPASAASARPQPSAPPTALLFSSSTSATVSLPPLAAATADTTAGDPFLAASSSYAQGGTPAPFGRAADTSFAETDLDMDASAASAPRTATGAAADGDGDGDGDDAPFSFPFTTIPYSPAVPSPFTSRPSPSHAARQAVLHTPALSRGGTSSPAGPSSSAARGRGGGGRGSERRGTPRASLQAVAVATAMASTPRSLNLPAPPVGRDLASVRPAPAASSPARLAAEEASGPDHNPALALAAARAAGVDAFKAAIKAASSAASLSRAGTAVGGKKRALEAGAEAEAEAEKKRDERAAKRLKRRSTLGLEFLAVGGGGGGMGLFERMLEEERAARGKGRA
ncbi:hypothetical protein JCM6882_005961 [Rhodosporidiobolus microsporus]